MTFRHFDPVVLIDDETIARCRNQVRFRADIG